ncbi:MAG: hypothetical protein AB7D20_11070 [Sulfuricurvum sp.]|uniref:hypothetical protein n=1 Tax=Sulfuricurvum sp. TaxID=2025608 RepID=UPI003D0CE231
MNKNAVMTGLLLAVISPIANAGFFGHIAEHAAGYAAGAIVAHEGEKAIDGYQRQHEQNQSIGQGGGANAGGIQADGRYAAVSPESQAMPNPKLTPGAINSAVTQQNLDETICRRGGYTKSIRPEEAYTEKLKRAQIREYGYSDTRLYDYEEDHLISLELGGSPDSPQNLWPEPHHVMGGWGSYAKDKLENKLHALVCHGERPLAQAQHEIATDWISSYKVHIGAVPNDERSHH